MYTVETAAAVRSGDLIAGPDVVRASDPLAVETDQGRISLSAPSKMPGFGFGFPAGLSCPAAKSTICKHGDYAVCRSCYAKSGRYAFPAVAAAYRRRFDFVRHSIDTDGGQRAELTLTYLIARSVARSSDPFFRFSDSGDMWRPEVARVFWAVAVRLPSVRFWIPTREYLRPVMLPDLRRLAALPNVTVRPSAAVLNQAPPIVDGLSAGTGVADDSFGLSLAFRCPATRPENPSSCDANDCRACWDADRPVVYTLHGRSRSFCGVSAARNSAQIARANRIVCSLPTI